LSFGGDKRAVGVGHRPHGPHHVGFAGLTKGVLAVRPGQRSEEAVKKAAASSAEGNDTTASPTK
jgi:hypothetical protein